MEQSLSHTKMECKYIFWIPKYRKKKLALSEFRGRNILLGQPLEPQKSQFDKAPLVLTWTARKERQQRALSRLPSKHSTDLNHRPILARHP